MTGHSMKIFSLICATIGGITILGVAIFALSVLFSGGTEGVVFALVIAFVLGIPAAGFATLMFGLAGALAAAAVAVEIADSSNDTPADVGIAGPVAQRKTLVFLSYTFFAAAVLWSVPYGFVTFVQYLTDKPGAGYDSLVKWLALAVPLIAIGFWVRSIAPRSHAPF